MTIRWSFRAHAMADNQIDRNWNSDMGVRDCHIVELPKISDPRGNLTFIEGGAHIPFPIERVYYIYDVPGGAERGAHGHKKLHQLMIAVSGSFNVTLDDGKEKKTFFLNSSHQGLYICPMIWRELYGFSTGSVCMVLASQRYDEDDYYRNYDEFLQGSENIG